MDWSQLPSDLLGKIAGALDEEIADRIRFSAVCKPWQSALKSVTNLPPLRLPWLLSSNRTSFSDPYVLRVLSLPESKTYALPLRKTRRGYIFAAHRDFFLTASLRETSALLNPITGARIPLPSLPPIVSSTHSAVERCKLIDGHEMLVVMVPLSYGNILCCRQIKSAGGGEDAAGEWTICGDGDEIPPFEYPSDFTYYRGRYFVLDERESTTSIFDPDTSLVVSVVPSVGTDRRYVISDRYSSVRRRYLAESSSGEKLFLVIAPSRTGKERFEVFELDETQMQAAKWSKVNSIGNDTLFLDSDRAMALPAAEFNGHRGNCIMFLNYEEEDESSEFSTAPPKVNGLSSFDVGDDRVEKLLCLDANVWGGEKVVWFVPGL